MQKVPSSAERVKTEDENSIQTASSSATANYSRLNSWKPDFQLSVGETEPNQSPAPKRVPTGFTIAEPDAVEESGRMFHGYKEGKYFLPNDGAEQDRLDLQHEVFRLLLDGKLGLAPVGDPARVLDVATGTGIWALEYAEQHPNSYVIGTDLSMIQPRREWLKNVEFIREDSEDPWIFPEPFDYIHFRAVVNSFNNTQAVIRQAFDNMNEGGWIEFQDLIGTFMGMDDSFEGTALQRWIELAALGFGILGRDVFRPMLYAKWLREAGFVDVVDQHLPAPVSPWPKDKKFKEIGFFASADVTEAIDSVGAKVFPAARVPPEEARRIMDQAKKDLKDTSIHAYCPVNIVYGRKPFRHE